MKRLRIASMLLLGSALVMTSCSGGEEKKPVIKTGPETPTKDTIMETEVFYQIPTPNELFDIIKKIGGKGNKDLLHKLDMGDKYTDARQKALNFGVYSADLAYASCYDFGTLNLDYMNQIKKMGEDMDISGAFDKTVFDAASKNMDNGDSIMKIGNKIYFRAYAFLEENERGPALSNIVAGAWIESLYLITSVAGPYKDKDPVIQSIAEQKINYENLWGFLMKYESDEGVKKTIADLEELGDIFNSLEMVETSEPQAIEKDGKTMFVGGTDIVITKQQYQELVKKIKEIRNRFTKVAA
jgi:hypothetical protein